MIEAIIYSVVALRSGMKNLYRKKIDCKARQSTICMTWDSANVNPGNGDDAALGAARNYH
jgi:hypothetical protein